jgi:hypothetical protein
MNFASIGNCSNFSQSIPNISAFNSLSLNSESISFPLNCPFAIILNPFLWAESSQASPTSSPIMFL